MTQVHQAAILIPLAVAAGAVACTIIIRAPAVIATVNFIRRERRLGRVGAGFLIDLSIVALVISVDCDRPGRPRVELSLGAKATRGYGPRENTQRLCGGLAEGLKFELSVPAVDELDSLSDDLHSALSDPDAYARFSPNVSDPSGRFAMFREQVERQTMHQISI